MRDQGEITITVDGQAYQLVLSVNALCAIEEHESTPEKAASFPEIWARLQESRVRDVRLMAWGALRDHHPEMTMEDAGRLIQRSGGLDKFVTLWLSKLLTTVDPDPVDLKALGVESPPDRPRKGRRSGTGAPSISSHAARVSAPNGSGV